MTDQENIPPVTMSNTKKEMVEAYQAIKQQLKAKERQVLDAEKARKQMEKQVVETTAESQASQDPLQRLHDLKSAISHELTDLADRFEKELETFRKVQSAVKDKQEELKTIYEIETAASDLAALIAVQQIKKDEFQKEMGEKRSGLDEEIHDIRVEWEKESFEYEQQVKEQEELLKKQRKREKEEYEYSFAREKEQKKNNLNDELQLLTKGIEQKKTEFESEYNQRKHELEAREVEVSKSEEEINMLRTEVGVFPGRLDESINKAIQETTERLASDFKKNEALLNAKYEGEKNVFLSKIESLEKAVVSQEAQITELSRRNEQAYEKVQDIANRAVDTAKREYITMPSSFSDKPALNEK